MVTRRIIEHVNEMVSQFMQDKPTNKEIEGNIKAAIMAVFSKLDLVTREEFDTQQRVLIATRKKLDEIEDVLKKANS
ncbi:MAG: accessory factor UbiK family protein [Proteobacteria bacterium]|jgi:BMFP domain-containing protein YqiC|nr:accessory factor UbiK family protein [Pseudomonadota bacterium]